MRDISDDALMALTGDRSGDKLLVVPFLDGDAMWDEALPLESWSAQWDRSSQVQGEISITVADNDGDLSPWAVDDPLGVGGVRLECSIELGGIGEEITLGTYRITGAEPKQSWVSARRARVMVDGQVQWDDVPARWSSGGRVEVTAQDETIGVAFADFLAPESVEVRNSVIGELERILDGLMVVVVDDGITDRSVPASVAYEGSRIDAVGSLVRAINGQYRVNSSGEFFVFPAGEDSVAWDVEPGEDGVLIDFARSYSAEDFINTMVVEGKDSGDGFPLIGVAREADGPLRVNGPHGMIPATRQSDILDTQAKVNTAARTYLRTAITDRAFVLPVTCLPNPALEIGDTVRIGTPVGDLVGPVETIRLSGGPEGINPMELEVTVPFEQVQAIGSRLRDES